MQKSLFLLFLLTSSFMPLKAQWNYVNPLPFTNNINTIFFINDSIGWAAGDKTIYKTTDAGISWINLGLNLPGDQHTIYSIYFVDKNKGWFTGGWGDIYNTTDGGIHWFSQSITSTNIYNTVRFVNESTGYIFGYSGMALKTTDGGSHWFNLTSTYSIIKSAQFFSEQTGYAVGNLDSMWSRPVLVKTTNGGQTWNRIVVDSTNEFGNLNSCYFIDTLTGWVVSTSVIYRTTNGGAKWKKIVPDSTEFAYFSSVLFKDYVSGCITATNSTDVYYTKDSGNTWQKSSFIPTNPLTCLVNSGNKFYAAGRNGVIIYSEDWGKSWSSLDKSFINTRLGGIMVDKNNAWAISDSGIIIKSEDGGQSWFRQQSNTNEQLYSISFNDSLNGFVSGANGTILKTTNGGKNWVVISHNIYLMSFGSIFFPDNKNGYCVGTYNGLYSVIYKTTNSGTSWSQLSATLPFNWIGAFYFTDSLNGWAGYDTLFRTTNGGVTWIKQSEITIPGQIQFTDPMHGWILSSRKFYKTLDGGNTWTTINLDSFYPNGFWFINENEGWTCGYLGEISRTTDAGLTWVQQTNNNPNLHSIVVKDNIGLAFGENGAILRTTNGGVTFIKQELNPILNKEYNLYQNYPNPFNPITIISYSINKTSHITLKIYDILGREVTTLINEEKSPGIYKINFNGSHLSSGVYFYTLQSDDFSISKKLIIMK